MREGYRSGRNLAFAIAIGVALAAFRVPSALAADAVEFNVGIADPVNTVLAMWMAQDAGLYAQNGLNVHFVNMNGGSRGAEALRTGQLDVMHVGLSSVVKINRAGGDLRVIGSLSNVIQFTFFSAPHVMTAADLKGGRVGVSSLGSESNSTVTLALRRLGLSRDDVKIEEYGGGPHRLAGVKSGEISATSLNEPFSESRSRTRYPCSRRSRTGTYPLAVQRHHRAAQRYRDTARCLEALSPSDRRRQLYGACQREFCQGNPR